jgi:hypothetical protein
MDADKIIIKHISDPITLELLVKSFFPSMDTCSVLQARFLLGKNAESNWSIYKVSSPNDTIFHVDKLSSPYVIVNIPMDKLTKEQIYAAAILCKSKSKHKSCHNLEILYTPISNTYLGDKVGLFIIKSENKKKIIKV